MSIFNRRYALLGWLTWVGAKTMMKHKAKQAVPGTVEGTRRPNKGAIAAGLAALGWGHLVLAAEGLAGRAAAGGRELEGS